VRLGRNVIIEFRRSGPNTQLCGFGSRTGQSSGALEIGNSLRAFGGAVVSEGKAMNKKSIVEWCRRMKQFHCETQEGLGGFAAAIVRSQDVPAIAQSNEWEAIAFTNAAIRWGAHAQTPTTCTNRRGSRVMSDRPEIDVTGRAQESIDARPFR